MKVETPEEYWSDGGIPERGNNASDIPLSACTIPLLPVTDIDPEFQDVKVLVHDDTPSKTLLLQLCRYVERQWLKQVIHWRSTNVRPRQSRAH